jgi:hypothetical protein
MYEWKVRCNLLIGALAHDGLARFQKLRDCIFSLLVGYDSISPSKGANMIIIILVILLLLFGFGGYRMGPGIGYYGGGGISLILLIIIVLLLLRVI